MCIICITFEYHLKNLKNMKVPMKTSIMTIISLLLFNAVSGCSAKAGDVGYLVDCIIEP